MEEEEEDDEDLEWIEKKVCMEEKECWKMILWWEVGGRGFAAPSRGFYQSSEDNLRLKSIKLPINFAPTIYTIHVSW